MGLICSAIVGIAAGLFVGAIMRGKGLGLTINIITGTVGAFLGGWIFTFLTVENDILSKQLLMAILGAITLLWILSFFEKKKRSS